MSPLKKGKLSEIETARLIPMNRDGQVETVIDVGVGIISPPWRVNSKLRSLITVSLIEMPLANSFYDFQNEVKIFQISNFLQGSSFGKTVNGYK